MHELSGRWVTIGLLIIGSLGTPLAQSVATLTDEQLQQFVHQAQANGMTVNQMETMAQVRGFSTADIDRMRQRIAALQPAAKPTPQPETSVVREQPATPAPPTAPIPTPSPVFGASLFANASLSFEPNLRIPTPRNYILGPDDELIVDVYGHAQQTYRPKVSPEGSIRLENLGPIYVNGLTIEQAEQRIVGRLRTLYLGLNTANSGLHAQVTLGSVRSIKVTLLGQVVRPGTYTLSSLATVFNALYAAGGPSPERGSFRDIRVYRANRLIRTLDIYDFLLRADQKDNLRLLDQDIIFVDHYHTRVELAGEVKQPGLYEMRSGETLHQVLAFAGGFTDRAYTAAINLRRNTPTEHQLLTIGAADVSRFVPQAGDYYGVGSILDRIKNRVSISGAVFRPGDYALTSGLTIRQVIQQAEGVREDAFLNRATLRRLRENLDPEIISIDLGKVIRGEAADIPLQREDQLHIGTVHELRQKRTVSVLGEVNKSGTFDFADSMTVANLIVLAGGFTDAAISSRMDIARRVKDDTSDLSPNQTIRLFTVTIDEHLRLSPADAKLKLHPFDQVFVRASTRYGAQKAASIAGEVAYAGTYAIGASTDRITDLIRRAGGLKPDAYLSSARFMRRGEVVSLDLKKILQEPTVTSNLLLEDGDVLTLPRRPDVVRIRGEVLNPAAVNYDPAKSFRDYVDEAGGFTRKALRRSVYVVAANGKIRPTHAFLGIRSYPKPERGAEIVVPARLPKEPSHVSSAERAAWITVIASGVAVLLTALRLFTN
ncbi:SLBB domain-containing protein [Spirosoma koreense]